jgi:hypothetical protein
LTPLRVICLLELLPNSPVNMARRSPEPSIPSRAPRCLSMFPRFHICQQKYFLDDRQSWTPCKKKKTCLVGRRVDTPCLVGSQFKPLRNQGLAETSGRHAGSGLLLLILPGCEDVWCYGNFHGETRATYETINLTYVNKPWEFMEFGSLPQVFGMSCRERIMVD